MVYCAIERNESFGYLQSIANSIIHAFLDKKVVLEHELQHISKVDGQWIPDFHLTVMRSNRKAIPAAKKLTSKYAEIQLGQCQVKEVHLSSREDFETPDGTRKKRRMFKKDSGASYACETKIQITFDD